MIVAHVFFFFFCFSFLGTSSQQDACDANCHFDGPELTSANIGSWPSTCVTVCGNLHLTSRTDVSTAQLTTALWKLTYLQGELHIENTNLTTLAFFQQLRSFYCGSRGFVVLNNSMLASADLLSRLYVEDGVCVFEIANNPKLNLSTYCEEREFNFDSELLAYNNFEDCGCRNVMITKKSLAFYPNCTSVFGWQGSLKISDTFNGTSLKTLSHLEKIDGHFIVENTDLEDLSALSKLSLVTGQGYSWSAIWSIRNNSNMRRLRLSALKNLKTSDPGDFSMTLNTSHPDFCLTYDELQLFADKKVKFSSLEAKICVNESRKDGQKVCVFEKMSSLENDCVHVRGAVLIDSGDEEHVGKLRNVSYIYGSLKIKNTQLENLTFFSELRNVISLKTFPPVQITSNKLLQNAALPKLKRLLALKEYPMMFQDNFPTLLKLKSECTKYENAIQADVSVNGRDCSGYKMDLEFVEEEPEQVASPTDQLGSEGTTVVTGTDKRANRQLVSVLFLMILFTRSLF